MSSFKSSSPIAMASGAEKQSGSPKNCFCLENKLETHSSVPKKLPYYRCK